MNKPYALVRQSSSGRRPSADLNVLLVPTVGQTKLVLIRNAKILAPAHAASKQDA